MRDTKIIKSIDRLGRFKIPRELLKSFHIGPDSYLKVFKRGKFIVIEAEGRNCIFCSSSKNIHTFKGQDVCKDCLNNLKNLDISHLS